MWKLTAIKVFRHNSRGDSRPRLSSGAKLRSGNCNKAGLNCERAGSNLWRSVPDRERPEMKPASFAGPDSRGRLSPREVYRVESLDLGNDRDLYAFADSDR